MYGEYMSEIHRYSIPLGVGIWWDEETIKLVCSNSSRSKTSFSSSLEVVLLNTESIVAIGKDSRDPQR